MLVLLVLAYMVVSTTGTALPVFRSQGISFVTGSDWDPSNGRIRSPLLHLRHDRHLGHRSDHRRAAEPGGRPLLSPSTLPSGCGAPIGYAVDLLAAVPSVIYGLWGVFVLLPLFLQPVTDFLAKYLGFIPIFKGPASGLSYFGAGVILAIMITPIITSLTREVLATVPTADRHAAYALGATRWEMIRQAVLPRSRAGIVGATMLGLGRALGETIAVALLIGSAAKVDASIVRPGYSMAAVIANSSGRPPATTSGPWWGSGWCCSSSPSSSTWPRARIVWRFNRI